MPQTPGVSILAYLRCHVKKGRNMPDSKRCCICGLFYEEGRRLTCSDKCHEELVNRIIAQHGEYQKIVCISTGIAHKVPTRDIIEKKGINERELDRYPLWPEGNGHGPYGPK